MPKFLKVGIANFFSGKIFPYAFQLHREKRSLHVALSRCAQRHKRRKTAYSYVAIFLFVVFLDINFTVPVVYCNSVGLIKILLQNQINKRNRERKCAFYVLSIHLQ